MSQVKKGIKCVEGLQYQAIEVALQAKALKECSFPGHSDWVLDQGDDEANRRAYAIGMDRWQNGEIDGEREEFLDAIRHVIRGAAYVYRRFGHGRPTRCRRLRAVAGAGAVEKAT